MAWTFTTLKTAIQDYTENSETTFVNNLSNFISDTEEKILKTVNLPVFRKNVSGTMTSGNSYLSAPSDFLTPFSLALDNSGYEYLMFKEVNFIREAYPVSSTTGVPKYYALFDNDSFILGPTPNANFTVELHYVYRPTSITTSADGTSWIGTNAPDALLYGSLVQAYSFMKGEADLIANYTQQYNEALSRLKVFAEGRSTKDAYRTGIIRQQVT
jgi:hypothetical protein|tara:strand:- start:774 stop:1415 length:642 start_codon:yes stop_codon:yes gene_type:complete